MKHSRFAYRDLSYTRSISDDLEILFFSALSLFIKDAVNAFNVVTGLPVERMHLAEDLIKRVKGERTVTLYNGASSRNTTINVNEIEVVPQPLGTYWSSLSTSAIPADGRIGVVDIGFKTTDFATIEDSEYVPEKSTSIPVGLATAYDDIGSNLITEFGIEKESHALDGIVINRKINISGETIDISNIIESAFEKLATNILVEIHSLWNTSEFDTLLLTGGGGQALSSYLLPQLSHAKLASDPITANCRGYLTWANRLWNQVLPQTNGTLKFD
ncbi:MAG: ParM/StbA family protein [Tepidanaerobacteraceae bacterium]